MAEENIDKIPATSCSIPGEDQPPAPAEEGGDKPNKSDSEATRQPKRRKNCPTSLDQLEAIKQSSPNSTSFSFTFDSNFVSTPESTPRFGSFNSAAMPELERCRQIPATSKGKAEEEDSKSETSEEAKEIEGALSSADASESAVD